jgi:hypothetical protein
VKPLDFDLRNREYNSVAMQNKHTIFILLATYNGDKYLTALLDSLDSQTDSNWILLVRDDGSTDQTVERLQNFASVQPKMRLIKDGLGRLGVTKGFEQLMRTAQTQGANFFAFCDQDDVWVPEKLARLRTALIGDNQANEPIPALAYSDLVVVNEDLEPLSHSFFNMNHSGEAWRAPGYWVLSHNLVPGCAMLGNRGLLDRCVPFPNEAVIHDWWVLQCAASMGRVVAVEQPLILYRQHGLNTIGAQSPTQKMRRFIAQQSQQCAEKQKLFVASIAQAGALGRRLSLDSSQERCWRNVITSLSDGLLAANRWRRLWAAIFGPVRRVGLARNILLVCVVWRERADPKLLDDRRNQIPS